jgi:hypothetical protein
MLELFAVGGVLFWTLIVAELVLLFVFTEYENGVCATISLVCFLAILQFMAKVNVIGFIWEHPLQLLMVAAVYLIAGACWGIFKWRRLVILRLRDHDDALAKFAVAKGLPENTTVLPAQYREEWKRELERGKAFDGPFNGQTLADTPLARKNKARITRWMSLWIFSMALFFLKDLVVEVFSAMYVKLAKFLQRIADNIYSASHVKTNLEVPKPTEDDGSVTR